MEDVYVFSEDAPYDLIDGIRESGMMPRGLRYAASVTGPWRLFGIYEMEDLSQLPALTKGAIGSDTGICATRGTRYLKKSVYHPDSAFVRIHVGSIDPEPDADQAEKLLEEIRSIVRDERYAADEEGEAESVMGDFDVLAYVGGDDADRIAQRIRAIRALQPVLKTVSLRVIDYVSTSERAADDHRVRPA
ncbi:MAG TPA: hypothetical protein VF984_02750 [Actinomycetota bacterium]